MKNLIEIGKKFNFINNCKLLVPLMFLVVYPVRKQYAFDAIQQFVGEDISHKRKRQLARKMVWCRLRYHFSYDEFFLFDAENLSRKGKASYISDNDHIDICNKMNDLKKVDIIDDKIEAYKVFKEFFGRDVCFVSNSSEGKNILADFVKKHPRFMSKTVDGSCGIGISIFDLKDYCSFDDLVKAIFEKYKDGFLAEELIIQTTEMAKFNPTSVNTFRIPTYRFKDRTEIRKPFMRMGQHGNFVDNAGSGGIFAMIDEDSGIIYSAVDEKGNSYLTHPDTKEQIVGYKVPRWEEIKEFAIRLAQVIPENRYIAWDIALTDKGCVMVESNSCGQFVHQIALKRGCRPEINEIMKEMGINS